MNGEEILTSWFQRPVARARDAGTLITFAVLATLVPTWRATRVDPLTALRMDG